ncbi:MAG: TatD DNase family protein [Chloroflexota bacterium]|nr:TatD DNase family protein [Chloroflexota bacterium]
MRLIDSHAHLQAEAFANDAADVLAMARSAGVVRLLAPGYDVPSSGDSIRLARRLAVDASAGIHPHRADGSDILWPEIVALATDPAVVAIGETGLDYDRGFSSREAQIANLRRHLLLAAELNKPAILHCRSKPGQRDAQDDLLRELDTSGRPPALLHSFSGPVDYAERALEMGLAISFSGLVFRKGEEASSEVARITPADRLLVETDSPYLLPPGAPRKRNEPRYVEITARWLAAQRGMDEDALGEQLVANYDRIFSRPPMPFDQSPGAR